MDLSGQLVLAHLEEDNTQRMLFRVRPLLSSQGLVTAEDIEEYKDDGFLRIAPDRQEQHNFKERVRELGSLCLMDFTIADQAQRKVRLNRNYAPFRGENNRYIVYSDAIKALPPDLVYEVVTKEENRHAPLTPRYYVRSGGFITGPYANTAEEAEGAPQSLPPDCDRLFLVSMPDRQHRMFYWPGNDATGSGSTCQMPQTADQPAPRRSQPEGASSVRTLADLFFRRRQPQAAQSDLNAAAEALENALSQAGFSSEINQPDHLLLIALACRKFQLSSPVMADAATAAATLTELLGLKALLSPTQSFQQGNSDRVVLSPYAAPESLARRHIILCRSHSIAPQNQAAYALYPWPVVSIQTDDGWPAEDSTTTPLHLESLQQQLCQHQGTLSPEGEGHLQSWQRLMNGFEAPLPLSLKRDMLRYLCHAQALLPDEHTALDHAAASFVLPYALFKGVPSEALQDMLAGFPEALKLL